MVKCTPKLPQRDARKRRRFENHARHSLLLHLLKQQLQQQQQQQETTPNSETNNNPLKTQQQEKTISSLTPSSKIMKTRSRRRINKYRSILDSVSKMRSVSLSPSSSTSPASQLTPTTPSSLLPPLPPPPSPHLIRRSRSDTSPVLGSTGHNISFAKRARRTINSQEISPSPMMPTSPNVPLLPLSNSPEFLRRSGSDPIPYLSDSSAEKSSDTKGENVKRRREEKAGEEVEKMSGEWIVIKCTCQCGKAHQFLVNGTEPKCLKLA